MPNQESACGRGWGLWKDVYFESAQARGSVRHSGSRCGAGHFDVGLEPRGTVPSTAGGMRCGISREVGGDCEISGSFFRGGCRNGFDLGSVRARVLEVGAQ